MTFTINPWRIVWYLAVGLVLVPVLSTVSCLRWRRQRPSTPLVEALIGQARAEVLLFEPADIVLRVLLWPGVLYRYARYRSMFFTGPTIRVTVSEDD